MIDLGPDSWIVSRDCVTVSSSSVDFLIFSRSSVSPSSASVSMVKILIVLSRICFARVLFSVPPFPLPVIGVVNRSRSSMVFEKRRSGNSVHP